MSEATWRALAEKALARRAGGLEALASFTPEGLRIDPLYARSLAEAQPALRQKSGAWSIAQRVDHPDPEAANRLALIDLDGGANALTLVFAGETARGFGLPLDARAVATALEGVELDYIALRLDAGARAPEATRALAGLATARRLTSATLAVDLGFDPIGVLARTGTTSDLAPDRLRSLLAEAGDAGLAGSAFLADGRPYHEAGAGEAQELAAVLATGLSYVRRLDQIGMALSDASASIAFLLVADADTFLSIAKLRALRRLWARVEEACGLTPMPIRLHAETAWRMMTRHDPWVNVMRATAAVFAAGIGSADVVTALPFTLPLGLPEDGARRLARNMQLVLLEEAHLGRVDDPASGSGGLEGLTEDLCQRAWALFQEIERDGGIEAALRAGTIQARIAATATARAENIATIAQGITGTSTYPPLDEPVLALANAPRRAPLAAGAGALPSRRDAEPFEALRERTDAKAAVSGRRPSVFLATLGSPAAFGSYATYAANFFAAAGLDSQAGSLDEGLADFDPAATPAVCLCAPDPLHAGLTPKVSALRNAGARMILLVGKPRVLDDLAGIDACIHAGCNALDILDATLHALSVEP